MKYLYRATCQGLLATVIFVSQSYAQTNEFLPTIIPPSPEAAALGKYGNFPVNNYTGTPNISIPIYQIQSRDLSIPISLSYHASGIKVNEEASWVGLGWTLQAGGVITRSVMGADDFESTSGGYYNNSQIPDIESVLLGGGWNSLLISEACAGIIAEFDCDSANYFARNSGYDFEPDQYNYNIPGGGGKFILRRDKTAVLEAKDKIKIEYISDSTGWEITTADGSIYQFEEFETTQDENQFAIKTAWYLTKIVSPLGEEIIFNYDKETSFNLITVGEVSEQKTHTIEACVNFDGFSNPVQRTYQSVTLSNIDFPNGQVVFDYNGDRQDLDGGKKLLSVEIYKKDINGNPLISPMKQYDFSYGYFIGSGDEDYTFGVSNPTYLTHRLKLQSVTEKSGSLTKPAYQFDYHEGGNNTMPSKASFARDHWGYYNGQLNNQSLIPAFAGFAYLNGVGLYQEYSGANRDPDAGFSQAFTLEKITYPTGGHTEFIYENHDYDIVKSKLNDMSPNALDPVLRDADTSFSAASGQTIIAPLDISEGNTPDLSGDVHVTLNVTYRCYNTDGCSEVNANTGDIFFQLYYDSAATNPVLLTDVDFADGTAETSCLLTEEALCLRTESYDLAPGKYYWKATVGNFPNFDGVTAQYSWFEQVDPGEAGSLPIAGGLRIKEIIDYDGGGTLNNQHRMFLYNYTDSISKSYGRLMGKPVSERYWIDLDPIITNISCAAFVRTSNSAVPLNGTSNGSSVGYDQVTILHGKDSNGNYGVNGKSVFEYINESAVIYNYAGAREPGIFNVKLNGNGNLAKQEDYKYVNGSYQIISKTTNQYIRVSASSLRSPETYQNSTSKELIYGIRKRKLVNQVGENGFYLYYYPAMHSEWLRHTQSVTLQYDQNDSTKFVSSYINKTYEAEPLHFQLVNQVTTNSDSQAITQYFKYPEDYEYNSTSTAIQKLVDKHQVNQPVEAWQDFLLSPSGTGSASATEFIYDASSNLVLPSKIHRLNASIPVSNFQGTTNGIDFSPYEERAQYHEYDDKGNVLEVSKTDDMHTVYLWGYNQTLPIAQIANTTYGDVENILGSNFHGGVDGFDGTEEDSLRNGLPNSMVTTYIYDALVGIISSTDPNGLTTTYEYDELNRLKLIIDHNGNIVKKFQYEYNNDGQL